MSSLKTLAIIPARKGSKRLVGKNMRLLAGKPLVQWTIEAALGSAAIDEVLVTSDDQQVLDLAKLMGVRHVIERPTELASDNATTMDVITHALSELDLMKVTCDAICLLQATSPLRTAFDINTAFQIFNDSGQRPIISVCELEHPLAWCNKLEAGGSMRKFSEAITHAKRSQDYTPYHRLNGAIYIAALAEFRRQSGFLNERTLAYIMPRTRSIDIDDIIDFQVAEALVASNSFKAVG